MAKKFETPEDLERQRAVAKALAQRWGCKLIERESGNVVDWDAMRDGVLIGVVELKTRTCASTQYTTVFVDVSKRAALEAVAAARGVPGILVMRWSDRIGFIRVADIIGKISFRGREPREGSANDKEHAIEVAISRFTMLKEHA